MERRQLAGGGAALRRGAGLALALLLPGCGGSSAGFAERADQALTLFERQIRLVEGEATELAGLDQPAGGDAAPAGLVAQIRAELDAAERLRIASLILDPESAQGAYARGRKAARRAHAYARRLGLIVCGRA